MNRRHLLNAAVAAVLGGCASRPRWVSSPDALPSTSEGPSAIASEPASPVPSPSKDSPLTRLLRRYLGTTSENPQRPMYAGAVALAMLNGSVVDQAVVGEAVRYGAGPVELPASQRVPMKHDSVFDLASITKVYTAILALQQVERGTLALNAPVITYLPGFDGPGKSSITVAQLLTHTAGLPVGAKLSGVTWASVLGTAPVAAPGKEFRYSSVGLMVIGQLVEKVTGQRLDQALRAGILQPLGLKQTGFLPKSWMSASDVARRMVATDARSSRGLLRGVVHDDVCHALGGIAGHAGIFSSAHDLAMVGQALLNNGSYQGKRLLSEATVRNMVTNHTPGLPVVDAERPTRPPDHGLGVALNQHWLMGKLASVQAYGHSGFTGTSLVICQRRKLVLVLLTNRAHPNWGWANPDPVRIAAGNLFA